MDSPVVVAPFLSTSLRQEIEMLRVGVLLGTRVHLVSPTAWLFVDSRNERNDPSLARQAPLRRRPGPKLFADDVEAIAESLEGGGGDLRYHGVHSIAMAVERAADLWAARGYAQMPSDLRRYLFSEWAAARARLAQGSEASAADEDAIAAEPGFVDAIAPVRALAQAAIVANERRDEYPSDLADEFATHGGLLTSEIRLAMSEGLLEVEAFDRDDMAYRSVARQHFAALAAHWAKGAYPFTNDRGIFALEAVVRGASPIEAAEADDRKVAALVAQLGMSFVAEHAGNLGSLPMDGVLTVREVAAGSLDSFRTTLHDLASEALNIDPWTPEQLEGFNRSARLKLSVRLRRFEQQLQDRRLRGVITAVSPSVLGGWVLGLPGLAAASGYESLGTMIAAGAAGAVAAVGKEAATRTQLLRKSPFYFLYRLRRPTRG